MATFPTPHLEKLKAALVNPKLPESDTPRITTAIQEYGNWIAALEQVEGTGAAAIHGMVEALDEYKRYIDLNLVFDSEEDFLYRQKGQLKLDNTILEEFLPRLMQPSVVPELAELDIETGPQSAFSAASFGGRIDAAARGGGLRIRTKDQDFTVSRKLYIRTSHFADFAESVSEVTQLAYVAAEIKTNLDKTMFQEACATAHDLKTAVAGAKYFLICEWLDMKPLSTTGTDIDEVLIVRKAKRLGSNVRSAFGKAAGRRERRDEYQRFLEENPYRPEVFERFVEHVAKLIRHEDPPEDNVLENGYF